MSALSLSFYSRGLYFTGEKVKEKKALKILACSMNCLRIHMHGLGTQELGRICEPSFYFTKVQDKER